MSQSWKKQLLAASEKPTALALDPSAIPAELKERRQWVCWRYERRDGKWTKPPINPRTGGFAKNDDASTWSTFEEALALHQDGQANGVGYVFTAEDPYTGVDLDDCVDPEALSLSAAAKEVINRLASYCEVSPSGTGVKLIVRGDLRPILGGGRAGAKRGNFEAYSAGRYFTVTGQTLGCGQIAEAQEGLAWFYAAYLAKPKAPSRQKKEAVAGEQEIWNAMRRSPTWPKIQALLDGDTSSHGGDDSAADLALLSHLAFWFGLAPTRMEAAFSTSALAQREKWRSRPDYRKRTIQKALEGQADSYVPPSAQEAEPGAWPDPLPLSTPSPVLAFPVTALPPLMAAFVSEAAESVGAPVDFAATAALVVAGGMVGATRSLRIKADYFTGCRLYAGLVAEPGGAKSPIVRLVTKPLFDRQMKLRAEYDKKKAEWEAELERWKAAKKKADKEDSDFTEVQPKKPVLLRCWSDDATVEALARILQENARGLTFIKDELTSLLLNLNAYKGGRGGDRQFFLSAWSGEPVGVDRKGNPEPLFIPHPWLGILGGIQPDLLGELRDRLQRSDGFIERFLFAFPDPSDLPPFSEKGISPATARKWAECLEQLVLLSFAQGESGSVPVACGFSADAKAAWIDFYNRHIGESNDRRFPSALRGYWSKLRDYAGRLALLLQLIRDAEDGKEGREATVELPAVEGSWRLIAYYKSAFKRVMGKLSADPEIERAERVLEWIRRERPDHFKRHDAHQDLRSVGLFSRIEDMEGPLERLCQHGYVRREEPKSSGRGRTPGAVFRPHPLLLGGVP